MDRKFLALFGAVLLAMAANAQTQAGAQAEAQANANASPKQASASASASSSGAVQSSGSSAAIADGTELNAVLSAPVDSKKAKPGDPVTARTTEAVKSQGKTVVPKGTKLVGHVTRASARGKGDADSVLGIAFDKAILKNGQEIPLRGNIQALASGETAASGAGADLDSMADAGPAGGGRVMSGGRSALGGVASTAGAVTNTAGSATSVAGGAVGATARASTTGVAGDTTAAVGGLTAAGQFSSRSRGVFGLNGLNLNAAGSNGTEGSVVTSAGKNVYLSSGTRMLIVSGASAREPKPAPGTAEKMESKPGSKQSSKQ